MTKRVATEAHAICALRTAILCSLRVLRTPVSETNGVDDVIVIVVLVAVVIDGDDDGDDSFRAIVGAAADVSSSSVRDFGTFGLDSIWKSTNPTLSLKSLAPKKRQTRANNG